MVKHGVEVVDVWVDHAVYSNLTGELNIKTQADIDAFLEKRTPLLLTLTEGHHFHTLVAPTQEQLDAALIELQEHGYIAKVS